MENTIEHVTKLIGDLKNGIGDKNDTETALLSLIGETYSRCKYLEQNRTFHKIEYGVKIGGENGIVDSCHFHADQDVYEYMNLILAKNPKFSDIPLKVMFREVGEWMDDDADEFDE